MQLSKVRLVLAILISLCIAPSAFAKIINLYDQPQDNAKVAYTLDSSAGVITIFTPKDSGWIKVADPRNGNVGWVKTTDLKNTGMTFNVMTTGDGARSFQVIQYGDGAVKPYTSEQWRKTMQELNVRQEMLQKDMQRVMQDMFKQLQINFPFLAPEPETKPIKPLVHPTPKPATTTGATAPNKQ